MPNIENQSQLSNDERLVTRVKTGLKQVGNRLEQAVETIQTLEVSVKAKIESLIADLESFADSPILTGAFLTSLKENRTELLHHALQVVSAVGLAVSLAKAADQEGDFNLAVQDALANGFDKNTALVDGDWSIELFSERIMNSQTTLFDSSLTPSYQTAASEVHAQSLAEQGSSTGDWGESWPQTDPTPLEEKLSLRLWLMERINQFLKKEQTDQVELATATTGVVTSSRLYFRQGPSLNSQLIGYLAGGTRLEIKGEVRDETHAGWTWLMVKTTDGEMGYVSPAYVNYDRAKTPQLTDDEVVVFPGSEDREPFSPTQEPTPVPSESQTTEVIPTPQPEAPPQPTQTPEQPVYYDYGAIPEGYNCTGTRAVVEVAQRKYPGLQIVFLYPGSGDPLIEGIYQRLHSRYLVAQTHEDDPATRNMPCYPNCQFWDAAILRDRGYGAGSVERVMDHEYIHNLQSANDPQLAEHVAALGGQAPINKGYQSLIEGHAEAVGAQVGPASYIKMRQVYWAWQKWANENGQRGLFDRAVMGDWSAYLEFVSVYEATTGTSLATFLSWYGW